MVERTLEELIRNARAIVAVETDEELASHSRGLIEILANRLDELKTQIAICHDVTAELNAKLNHESYVSDKRAQERDKAETEVHRLRGRLSHYEALEPWP